MNVQTETLQSENKDGVITLVGNVLFIEGDISKSYIASEIEDLPKMLNRRSGSYYHSFTFKDNKYAQSGKQWLLSYLNEQYN